MQLKDLGSIARVWFCIPVPDLYHILYGCRSYEIQNLQSVQNAAARLITHSKKYDHNTLILKELHWLPVEERIIFKNLLFVKNILSNEAPLYLSMYQAEQILDPLNPMF